MVDMNAAAIRHSIILSSCVENSNLYSADSKWTRYVSNFTTFNIGGIDGGSGGLRINHENDSEDLCRVAY